MHALKPAMIQLHTVQYSTVEGIRETGRKRGRRREGTGKWTGKKSGKGQKGENGTGQDGT